MTPMRCDDCRRSFGGTVAYEAHLDRRHDRCRTAKEMHARGLRRDAHHVWHRRSPVGATSTLPGILRGSPFPAVGREPTPEYPRNRTTQENAPSPVGGSSARRGLRTASPEAHAPARANANPVNVIHTRGGAGADEA